MHWEQCFRMIKRRERLQGWQYDLIIKWSADRQPPEASPNAADPRWGEFSDTDNFSQGINQASTPLNIPFDQWFVNRRKSAHVIMSEFVDTIFDCQNIALSVKSIGSHISGTKQNSPITFIYRECA